MGHEYAFAGLRIFGFGVFAVCDTAMRLCREGPIYTMKNGDMIRVELYGKNHIGKLIQFDRKNATVEIGGKRYRIDIKQIFPAEKNINEDAE